MTRTLALLCCLLVLLPGRAHAYPNVWLGAGYASNCLIGDECRRGARGELSLDLTGWERSKVTGGGGSTKASSTGKGNAGLFDGNCGSGNCSLPSGGGGGDALALIAVILLAALIAYGLYLGVAALFSSEISLNVYYSQDSLAPPGVKLTDKEMHDIVRRWGLRSSFYPSQDWPLRLHFGAGPASSLTRQRVDEATGQADEATEDSEIKREYRDGFASHMGVGLTPRPGNSGMFLVYEAEYLTLASRTIKDVLKDNKPTRLPQYGVGRALTTGFVVSF